MMERLDLSDPLTRQMADRNHVPAERWSVDQGAVVICEQCGETWPCEVRRELDAMPAETDTTSETPNAGSADSAEAPLSTHDLDMGDPAIRAMAVRNHAPQDTWTVAGTLVGVFCEHCYQAWPCSTRRALDDWNREYVLSITGANRVLYDRTHVPSP